MRALPTLSIIGFGAFGRLMATHLRAHFALAVHDPQLDPADLPSGVAAVTLAEAAACPIVVLAVPVSETAAVARAIAPIVRPGALILDVGSVKAAPCEDMLRELPAHADIVATHPLFGPQSAAGGLAGLKIAVCPARGPRWRRVAAFLRRALALNVIVTTPDAHDRDLAVVQGLTHLIARVLVRMEPLPTAMTTRSFELMMQAVGMVRDDAACVFDAVERGNRHAPAIRRQFFALAQQLDAELSSG